MISLSKLLSSFVGYVFSGIFRRSSKMPLCRVQCPMLNCGLGLIGTCMGLVVIVSNTGILCDDVCDPGGTAANIGNTATYI